MSIIDPPVTPYHAPDEIRAWLAELDDMEQSEEVETEKTRAEGWLDAALEREGG